MGSIQNFFTSRDNNTTANTYVGQLDRLWYDPVTNTIYVSDGNTPGGIAVGSGGSGNGVAGGPVNSVQYNAGGGTFGGTANIVVDPATGNVVATGNITADYFVGNGSQLTGLPATYGNANVAAYLSNGQIANIIPGSNAVYSLGNATNQWKDLWVSNSTIYFDSVPLSANNNTLTFDGQPVLVSGGSANITTTGVIESGGLVSDGNISANTGYFFIGDGGLLSNISAGTNYSNANVAAYLASNANVVITTTGNVSGAYIFGNGSQLTGLPATYGNSDVASYLASNAAVVITVTGNVTAGNLVTVGNVSGAYILGNGSQLSGLPAQYGNANVADYLTAYTGNISAGNINVTDDIVVVGDVTAGVFYGTFAGNISGNFVVPGSNTWVLYNNDGNAGSDSNFRYDSGTDTLTVNGTANIVSINATDVTATGNITGNLATAAQPNITSVGTLTNLSVTGNTVTSGILTSNYYYANGSPVSFAGTYSNATVAEYLASNANVVITVTGDITTAGNITATANIAGGNITTAGNITATGNVSGQYILGDGSFLTGIAPTIQVYQSANIASGINGYYTNQWLADYVPQALPANVSAVVGTTGTFIVGFITELGYPNISVLPIGAIVVQVETQKTTGPRSYGIYAEIYSRTTGGTETLLTTSDTSSITADNTAIQQKVSAYITAPVTLATTDRIVIKIYGLTSIGTDTITVRFDNNTGSGLQLPALPASVAQFVPYTGATANLDLGTHSLTTTGNVTANYFIGNGSQLTGLPATYGNANVADYLASNANVVVVTTGNITTTGTVAAGDANIAGQVFANGNIEANTSYFFIGDGGLLSNITVSAGTEIFNGNTSVGIPVANGNVTVNITGTANVVVFNDVESTFTSNVSAPYFIGNGSQLTGLVADYGNANVAEYLASNAAVVVATTGNITTTGNVEGAYILGNGSQLTGIASSYGNADVANYLPTYTGAMTAMTGNVTTTANIEGAYILGNGSALTSLAGDNVTGTVANAAYATLANNATTAGTVTTAAQPNITSVGTLTSLTVTGNIVSSGNVSGVYILGNGSQLTGLPAQYGNANVADYLASNAAVIITTTGNITTAGNVAANYFVGNGSQLSGLYGNATVANYLPTYTGNLASLAGNVTTTANVTAANVVASNVTASLNISANAVSLGTGRLQLTGNTISSTADTITIDPLGDGAGIGTVIVQGNMQVTGNLTYNNIVNTTTNDLQWIAANNAINQSAASGAGLAVGPTGSYASFTYNSAANVWQASLPLLANGGVNANGALSGATTGSFSGNVSASNFSGVGALLTGNLTIGGDFIAGNSYISNWANSTNAGIAQTLRVGGQIITPDEIQAGSLAATGVVSATGNVDGGNINTLGLIRAQGNISTDSFFVGDGSFLTGVVTEADSVANGTSSITITPANSNIAMTVAGTANVLVVSATGIAVAGTVDSTGNITGGNIATAGLISATGNVTGGNLNTGAQVVATGNITGGNLNTAGRVVATGNITATANIAGGNITTAGLISATGNITATANIAGGNITTAGLISATGNITSAANITSTGNIVTTAGNILVRSSNGNITLATTASSNVIMTRGGFPAITISSNSVAIGNTLGSDGFYVTPVRVVTNTSNASSGNVMFYNTATQEVTTAAIPAFSVLGSGNTVISATFTPTQVAYATEVYDSNGWFASNRYTPQRAGWYQINCGARCLPTGAVALTGERSVGIRKNGTYIGINASYGMILGTVSEIIYFNGSTDYVDVVVNSNETGNCAQNTVFTFFNGYWVRP